MKRCPYCAEEVLEAAILCKHCRSDLRVPPRAARAGRLLLLGGAVGLGLLLLPPAAAGVGGGRAPAALPAGACPVGAGAGAALPALPPGHPPVAGLPPGHPPVAGLPPGHPPVDLSPAPPLFPQDPAREL